MNGTVSREKKDAVWTDIQARPTLIGDTTMSYLLNPQKPVVDPNDPIHTNRPKEPAVVPAGGGQ
jgi:hypothetical protein